MRFGDIFSLGRRLRHNWLLLRTPGNRSATHNIDISGYRLSSINITSPVCVCVSDNFAVGAFASIGKFIASSFLEIAKDPLKGCPVRAGWIICELTERLNSE